MSRSHWRRILATCLNAKGISISLVFLLVVSVAAKAEIRIDRSYGTNAIRIIISRDIAEPDAKEIQDISNELEYKGLYVLLESTGGDVSAAMKIGRLVRKYDGQTLILREFYSSCALIFIAGVKRINYGKLGLHRPFFVDAPQSRETLERQAPLMLTMVKSYITEMGITDNFYQQMVNTEPSKMLIYEEGDYTSIVPATDPTYDEIQVALAARKYGISTLEMRRRELKVESCGNPYADLTRYDNCSEAIKWGLSEQIYLDRKAKVEAHCRLSAEEQKTVNEARRSLLAQSPLVLRQEDCARNIMLTR